MKIEGEAYSIEASQDFKKTSFGIDAESMPLMMRMLYSNLYSDPIGSIVRELTSNCVDAHTEVGQAKNYEVEIVGANRFTGIFEDRIIFRDYGPGLSPDRMENIYTQYFASTKRAGNTQIGGFGLGCKSPLAYSDSFFINTTVDGTLYKYTVQRVADGDSELILLQSDPTDKCNGTEIEIPIKSGDLNLFKTAIDNQLAYFKKLSVLGYIPNFIDAEIVDYTNYTFNSKSGMRRLHAILGNVSYPINEEAAGIKVDLSMNIALRFNIGELSVSINREALYYDEKTKKAIVDKYELAKAEALDILKDSLASITDIFQFINEAMLLIESTNAYSFNETSSLSNIRRLSMI
jgi:hypothetical protein